MNYLNKRKVIYFNTKHYIRKAQKSLILLIVIMLSGALHAQQDPHYTQYMYNQNIFNPAYAGSAGDLSIGLLGRTQWVGLEGAPDTQTLNINTSLLGHGLGVGLSVIHDVIGPAEESNLALDLSYSMDVSAKGKLAFGVKGSYNFLNISLINDVLLNDDGDIMFDEDVKDAYPNMGAGFYYHTDKFYAGISLPNIFEKHTYLTTGNEITDVSDKLHYFGTLGYVFDINDNLKFKPSTMIKMVQGAPISFDINGSFFFDEKFEVGLSYRDGDSIDAIIGFQVMPSLRIGYAYDHTLTNIGDYNSGSHELMLLFDMLLPKKQFKSPRYF